jgi:hypothetical protein
MMQGNRIYLRAPAGKDLERSLVTIDPLPDELKAGAGVRYQGERWVVHRIAKTRVPPYAQPVPVRYLEVLDAQMGGRS